MKLNIRKRREEAGMVSGESMANNVRHCEEPTGDEAIWEERCSGGVMQWPQVFSIPAPTDIRPDCRATLAMTKVEYRNDKGGMGVLQGLIRR